MAARIVGAHLLGEEELLLFLQGVLLVTVVASLAFHIFAPVTGSKLASAAATVLGVVYIGFLFSFFVLVREMPGTGAPGALPFGLRLFVVVLFATWGADTGAYAAGKTLGRHKLCPAVSPGKTVEGMIGGFLLAMLVSSWLGWWAGFRPDHAIALGVLAAALGLVGDLSKSVIKRDMGVKDFGTLIPGHGGVLDRFDSLLINMPAAYFLAMALMR
ncbi:MAG: phosphatidate cytidylyltransferase [Armatimonadetes bacterium]|nr:phosphatidate cytidylyltransferase [Armatimonadota bacterium]